MEREESTVSSVNVGFHSKAVISLELIERQTFTAEEFEKALHNYLGDVVEEVCENMRTIDDNFRPSTMFNNIDPTSSSAVILVYEEMRTVMLQSDSLKTQHGPDKESAIGEAGMKKLQASKY
ncbi:hypothetical protein BY996DRAFT_6416406 [Phakopsora pachyrhizi]|nr:hypothetical protein BY996DRAFT_6416406 [Phakopsora pachyrhizi]